jgi:2-polyprenyl-3-methyl-5-hydroxy-6-metoxy-1,4-benzoquinol methylase
MIARELKAPRLVSGRTLRAVRGLEEVACALCGSARREPFLSARDDLHGTPGRWSFVRCIDCGLAYQSPRLPADELHREEGPPQPGEAEPRPGFALRLLQQRVLERQERAKVRLLRRYVGLTPRSHVLDVGCGRGGFLQRLRALHGVKATGVDRGDRDGDPALEGIDYRQGPLHDLDFGRRRFELITLWHSLQREPDPSRTLATARGLLASGGKLVIEVPRLDSATFWLFRDRWPGVGAPRHTALYDRERLLRLVERAGMKVVDHLPYGALPAYHYLFTGAALRLFGGRGLDLTRAMPTYLAGQLLLGPLRLLERRLNLAVQTVICQRRAR